VNNTIASGSGPSPSKCLIFSETAKYSPPCSRMMADHLLSAGLAGATPRPLAAAGDLLRAARPRTSSSYTRPSSPRPDLMPQPSRQPAPAHPPHRLLLAAAQPARRCAQALLLEDDRVYDAALAVNQDCGSGGRGRRSHPRPAADGLPRCQDLPFDRGPVRCRRTVMAGAMCPDQSNALQLQTITRNPTARHRQIGATHYCERGVGSDLQSHPCRTAVKDAASRSAAPR
jgi:hypothetical protein